MTHLTLLEDRGYPSAIAQQIFKLATDLYSVVLENKADRPALVQALLPAIIAEIRSARAPASDPAPAERFIRELAEGLAQDAMTRACGMPHPAKWGRD